MMRVGSLQNLVIHLIAHPELLRVFMKRLLSRLLSLVLVICVGLMGCTPAPSGSIPLSGDYHQDSLTVIGTLRTAIQQPNDSPDKAAVQEQARQLINDFSARYRRDGSLTTLISFTTMRTALNSLAAHYSSYPNRPVPQKMKDRLEQEFKQIETAIARGA
jgi:photosystem II Psb27 protein